MVETDAGHEQYLLEKRNIEWIWRKSEEYSTGIYQPLPHTLQLPNPQGRPMSDVARLCRVAQNGVGVHMYISLPTPSGKF